MTKSIAKIIAWLACVYLLVATLTFSVRHPWATDMQIALNIKSVLLFRRVPTEYHSKCLGCGAEFFSDQPSDDVTVCPLCPMSEEEFNQLIEELKRDNCGRFTKGSDG